jgi:cytoskeletal protein RodZ
MTTMEAKSFGEYLKNERELRNISLEEMAGLTRINIRYLEAIEDNDFDIIPAETFVKGFIRSYAKCIGLDEDDVILTYEYFLNQQQGGNGLQSPQHRAEWSGTRKLLLIFLVLIFLLIFIILLAYHFSKFTPVTPGVSVLPGNTGLEIAIGDYSYSCFCAHKCVYGYETYIRGRT